MKQLRRTLLRFATLAVIVVAAASVSGCSIPIGPLGFNVPLGLGVFNATSLGLTPGELGTGEQSFDLCFLSSLLDIEELLALATEDVPDFIAITVTNLDIVSVTFTATTGDFSGLDEVTVWIQPKDLDGVPQDRILLGSATGPHDPVTSVTFNVESSVNLLDFIGDNDANPGPDCPKVIIEVTGTISDTLIAWVGDVDVDGFGLISF